MLFGVLGGTILYLITSLIVPKENALYIILFILITLIITVRVGSSIRGRRTIVLEPLKLGFLYGLLLSYGLLMLLWSVS